MLILLKIVYYTYTWCVFKISTFNYHVHSFCQSCPLHTYRSRSLVCQHKNHRTDRCSVRHTHFYLQK